MLIQNFGRQTRCIMGDVKMANKQGRKFLMKDIPNFCLGTIGRFNNKTGTSVDDGARKSNNWFDQWQSGKLGTGSHA